MIAFLLGYLLGLFLRPRRRTIHDEIADFLRAERRLHPDRLQR